MKDKTQQEIQEIIQKAVSGDKKALEELLLNVQDLIFNLSLRMLGTIPDAEDATQEILVKIMTHLSAFRQESAFSTWVFRISVNYLMNYKKSMFSKHPLSFEFYGNDIQSGKEKDIPDLTHGVDKALLEQELKISCTNVMLQCLDARSRCIFILGTMFKVDSHVAGDILDMSPEAYRQKLSRIRRKMADFLGEYCGLSGGCCSCKNRINYAIASHRLSPDKLEYSALEKTQLMIDFVNAMDNIDDISSIFSTFPSYKSTEKAKEFLVHFLDSEPYNFVINS